MVAIKIDGTAGPVEVEDSVNLLLTVKGSGLVNGKSRTINPEGGGQDDDHRHHQQVDDADFAEQAALMVNDLHFATSRWMDTMGPGWSTARAAPSTGSMTWGSTPPGLFTPIWPSSPGRYPIFSS